MLDFGINIRTNHSIDLICIRFVDVFLIILFCSNLSAEMVKGQAVKRASTSQPAASKMQKTVQLADSVSPDRESSPEAVSGPSVAKVLRISPDHVSVNIETEESAKLDKLFSDPILQDVINGTTTDTFPVIITNRKLVNNFWHFFGRDKGHSTQSLECVKKLHKKAEKLELPALLMISQFQNYKTEGAERIVIEQFAVEKLRCNLRNYMAKNFENFPEIISAKKKPKNVAGSTTAVDIYDLQLDSRMVELNVKIISASLRSFKEKPGEFLLFGAQDNTGTIAGRIWEHPERYTSLIKEGAMLTIKNPGIVKADPTYDAKYTSNVKLEIIQNQTTVTVMKPKRI